MSRGGESAAVPPLRPEVYEAIQAWKPHTDTDNPQVMAVVAPAVRAVVAASAPETPELARRWLPYALPMLVWTDKTVGSLAPGVINPRNVDKFVGPVSQGAGRLPGWRSGARSALTQIGRAVNPHAWGDKTTLISGRSRPLPYDADEEGLWQMFGRLPGARDPARRLWVVAASCSLGMRGSEISLAETSDIHERDDGRLAVDVRGRKPRRVPVRECWTDAVREAVALVNERPRGSPRRFVTIEDLNAAARTAASLPEVVEGGFSLPRARNTWLAAHLEVGTRPHVLRMLAGGLNEKTITHLLSLLDPLTPEEAVAEGLRA